MNHTRRKYYVILAVKKDDSNDVLGLCEHSYSMGWHRDRVLVWNANDDNYIGKPASESFGDVVKSLKNYGAYSKGLHNLKGKMTMTRKSYSDHSSDNFCPCGRSRAEFQWNWVKHYAIRCGKRLLKKGYDIRPYRVCGKFCPVNVDFTERTAIEKKQLPWDKYKWRNPRFTIKRT